jgi:hypothetical protein
MQTCYARQQNVKERAIVADINKTLQDANKTLKDAAYVAVGFGVLTFQKAQVRRRELAKQVKAQRAQVGDPRSQLNGLVKTIDDRFRPVRQEIEGRLDTIEAKLPPQAKELVKTARTLAKDTEGQVRKLVRTA